MRLDAIASRISKLSTDKDLLPQLTDLKVEMAHSAQKALNEWEQDENGQDVELGTGGVCDQISRALSEVILKLDGIDITEGGHEGDDHSYIIVYNDDEAFSVDIPPYIYETGGGYSWKKKPNVKIQPDDILIERVDRLYIL